MSIQPFDTKNLDAECKRIADDLGVEQIDVKAILLDWNHRAPLSGWRPEDWLDLAGEVFAAVKRPKMVPA